ncbi:MAG: HD domain-containing protein [Defluviitaleaceae bacterium]|nr:HD domain-containing protein [Defluviitaleaceae bacterium]
MKYIEDFKEDDLIIGHYLCKQRQSLKARNGKTYLSLFLQDKTGIINAKVWELNNDIQNFVEKDVIKIEGVVLIYQNTPQLRITKIRKSKEGEYDTGDFIPTTDKDVDSLYNEILGFISSVSNVHIKTLLENIFVKNVYINENIKTHSAAKSLHHGYMGGLIEHIVSVTDICNYLSGKYKFVNRDILIAAALVHDIGKIYELSPFPDNDYTDQGELLGHIVIGVELINSEAAKIEGFPQETLNLIKHCIVSHHGELEFGSPQPPKTTEAMLLHSADSTDSKIKMYEEALEKADSKVTWVGYHKLLARNIRKSTL